MQVSPTGDAEDLAAGLGETAEGLAAAGRPAEADAEAVATYWNKLANGGWPLLGAVDEGGGVSLVDLCHIAEEWGRHLLPVPLLPGVLVRRWGGAPAGTPVGTPLTYALPAGTDESWVPFASFPSVQVVGWGAEPTPIDLGSEVDSFAPTCPIGSVPSPCILAADQVGEARVVAVAEALGAAARSLTDSVEHAKTRRQFGRPIGAFQAVQHILADMYRDLEIGRSLVLCAAHAADKEIRDAAVAEGLLRARQVIERAIQTHGGIGFTWELDLHFRLRHVLALAKMCETT